jgi:hypothetical protein
MASIFDWSATDSANTGVSGININTGMDPKNIDNAIRAAMAVIRGSFAAALQNFLAGTAALPVANGGTGGTDSASALAGIGALASTYRDLPISARSAAFAFADSDRATAINYTGAAAAATINPNATTAITTGATIVVRNAGTGALTLTRGSGVTLKKNGSATSADAILAVGGVATLVKWGTDDWTVTGSSIS